MRVVLVLAGTLAVSIDDDVGMGADGEGTIICEGLPIGAPLSFCSASYSYDVNIKLVGPKGKTLKRVPKSNRGAGRPAPSQGAYFASFVCPHGASSLGDRHVGR